MRITYTNKKKSKNNKTKKLGGSVSVAIFSIFTACISVLQFIYYITAINKNIQPSDSSISMVSYADIKKIAESYPEGSPALLSEKGIKILKNENPKGIKAAIEQKYLKKIKRRVNDKIVEGYTLSAKGKKLISDNVDKLSQ